MARPLKQGLDYFPFDTDFFNDEKIVCIAGEFGLKGEMVAVRLLCAIYRKGYFIEWDDRARMKMLRELTGINSALLDMIIDRLVRWGFFDAPTFDSAKVLTSRGIQTRYFSAVSRRALADCEFPYLLIDVDTNTLRPAKNTPKKFLHAETPVIAYNNPVIARNNAIKENKIKSSNTTTPLPPQRRSGEGSVEMGRDELSAELKASDLWLDQLCMSQHISMPSLLRRIDEFIDDCTGRDNMPKTLKEAKFRFFGFLTKRLEYERSNNNRPVNGQGGFRSKLPPPPGCGLIEDD